MDNRNFENGSPDESLWAAIIGLLAVLGLTVTFIAG